MNYLLLCVIFIAIYITSAGIFSLFDWFQKMDPETQKKKLDWGKICGFAVIPAVIVTVIVTLWTRSVKQSYKFNGEEEDLFTASPASPVSTEALKKEYYKRFGKTEEEMKQTYDDEAREYNEYQRGLQHGYFVADPYGRYDVDEPLLDRAKRKWGKNRERIVGEAQAKKNKRKAEAYAQELRDLAPGGKTFYQLRGDFEKKQLLPGEREKLIASTLENIQQLETLPQSKNVTDIIQDLQKDVDFLQS